MGSLSCVARLFVSFCRGLGARAAAFLALVSLLVGQAYAELPDVGLDEETLQGVVTDGGSRAATIALYCLGMAVVFIVGWKTVKYFRRAT